MSRKRNRKPIATHIYDGYSNATANLGEASPLLSTGTFVRNNLTQNTELLTVIYRESWIAKKIVDMPAEDATRKWYTLSADIPNEDKKRIAALESKHSIKNEITNALKWARLYGGAIAIIVVKGDENILDQPLDRSRLYPGCFGGILVVDKSQGIEASLELEEDIDDPDFGLPKYYSVNVEYNNSNYIKVHHSRVLRFIGRELPYMESVRENYWGASEIEHIWEELQKRSAVSANIAQLVFSANVTTLKISDFGEMLAMGTERQRQKILDSIELQNRLRTSFGLQVLSSEDSMENHPYSFAGLSEVYELFMLDMAGAAEIPATKLFGRSPQGLNATGESDLKNYYEKISQFQETYLKPAIEKLLPVIEMSANGYIAEDGSVVFEPLMLVTPAERVDNISKFASTITDLVNARLITRESALEELKAMGKGLDVFSTLVLPEIEEHENEDPCDYQKIVELHKEQPVKLDKEPYEVPIMRQSGL